MNKERLGLALAVAIVVVYLLMVQREALQVAASPLLLGQTWLTFLGLPVVIWLMLRSPSFSWKLMFGLFILEAYLPVKFIPASVASVFNWLCLAIVLVQRSMAKSNLLKSYMLNLFLILYTALAVLRYLKDPALPTWGEGGGSGFARYFYFFSSFVPYVVLPHILPERDLRKLPGFLLGVSFAAFVLKLVVILFPRGPLAIFLATPQLLEYLTEARYSILARSAGSLLLSSTVLFLFHRRGRGLPTAMLYALGALGGLGGLFMTGTRSLVVGAAAAMVFAFIMRRWFWQLAVLMALFLAAVLAVSSTATDYSGPLSPVVRSLTFSFVGGPRSRHVASPYVTTDTFSWRQELWSRALRKIRENPLIGKGFYSQYADMVQWSAVSYGSYTFYVMEGELGSGTTHNLFLGPVLTFGIPAGILFALYVLVQTWRLIRLCFTIPKDHEFYIPCQLLGTWVTYILVSNLTIGGTVATDLFLVLALSHVLIERVRAAASAPAPVPAAEPEPAPALSPRA